MNLFRSLLYCMCMLLLGGSVCEARPRTIRKEYYVHPKVPDLKNDPSQIWIAGTAKVDSIAEPKKIPGFTLPETQSERLRRIKRLPGPLHSHDNSFSVFAQSEERAGYRWAIMKSADQNREHLKRFLKVDLGSSETPIQIIIGRDKALNTEVLKSSMRGFGHSRLYRITLPNPETCDLTAFHTAVAEALFRNRSEMLGHAASAYSQPEWYTASVLRYSNLPNRSKDYDTVWLARQQGRLPSIAKVFDKGHDVFMRSNLAFGSAFAGFIVDQLPGKAHDKLLTCAWTQHDIAQLLFGSEVTVEALDIYWQEWLDKRGDIVSDVGVTTYGAFCRWKESLMILDPQEKVLRAPDWIVAYAAEENSKALAAIQIQRIYRKVIGRSSELHVVADAYSKVFHAVVIGESNDELRLLLRQADALCQELELKLLQDETGQAITPEQLINKDESNVEGR